MRSRAMRIVFVLLCLSGSMAQAQSAQPEYPYPASAWPTSTPEAEGIDPAAIDALVEDIEAGHYGLMDHFLLIRHGKLVADHHFVQNYDSVMALHDTTNHQYNYDHTDWHPFYKESSLHTLQSVTKSVTSAALGIAIDEGRIDGVEVPVMPLFENYDFDRSDPRKAAITLEDFLTMRSGIAWETAGGYSSTLHTTIQLEASEQWIQFVLDRDMDAAPGTIYEYNDGVSVLIGKIIGLATGQRADLWTAEKLFAPLGITEYYWKITPDGEADTEGGLYLAPHDLARIGYLFLRGGRWQGRQIISQEWVSRSVAPVVPDVAPNNDRQDPAYGYQWWVIDHDGAQPRIFAGNGYGGQFVMIAPEYDVVVVFNGWNIHERPSMSSYRALQDRLLPAMQPAR